MSYLVTFKRGKAVVNSFLATTPEQAVAITKAAKAGVVVQVAIARSEADSNLLEWWHRSGLAFSGLAIGDERGIA